MKVLPLYTTEPIDTLAWPAANNVIDINSSASSIFTDFKKVRPLIIDSTTAAIDAEKMMLTGHVRLEIVVGAGLEFLGIVTLSQLQGPEWLKKVAAGHKREDLMITDFMLPKCSLNAFDFADIAKSSIGDVIETLKAAGQQHCLVIDRTMHEIRGIISASDIARKLKLSIDIGSGSTFVNIFKAVKRYGT